jgi:hypothetical protein
MKSTFTRRGVLTSLGLLVSATAFLATTSIPVRAQGAWKDLFNGKDFSGWTVPAGGGRRGAAAPTTPPSTNPADRSWKVENGVITSVPTTESKQPSGGLNTVDKYLDFELTFDYKLDEAPNTDCTAKLGPKAGRNGQVDPQANLSKDGACTFNSGISFRSGYQLNIGRREAGEFVGLVIHRDVPFAIRAEHVAWLSTGDCGAKNDVYLQDCSQFPEIRHKNDWNSVRISAKGPKIQAWLNGHQIVDVTDNPTLPGETTWKEAQPLSFQFPPAGEGGGFAGRIQYKNIKVRTL